MDPRQLTNHLTKLFKHQENRFFYVVEQLSQISIDAITQRQHEHLQQLFLSERGSQLQECSDETSAKFWGHPLAHGGDLEAIMFRDELQKRKRNKVWIWMIIMQALENHAMDSFERHLWPKIVKCTEDSDVSPLISGLFDSSIVEKIERFEMMDDDNRFRKVRFQKFLKRFFTDINP